MPKALHPLTVEEVSALVRIPGNRISIAYQAIIEMDDYLFICDLQNERALHVLAKKEATMAAAEEERYQLREEEKRKAAQIAADLNNQQDKLSQQKSETKESQSDLNKALAALLAITHTTATPVAQLVAHHQQLMNNFNLQLAAQLKRAPMKINGKQLKVPPQAPPLVPVNKVIAANINPDLAKEVLANTDSQSAFATFHTQAEVGPFAMIKWYRAIMEYNNMDESMINISEKTKLMRFLDKNIFFLQESLRQNKLDFVTALLNNNSLLLKTIQPAPTLTKTHTTFSARPQPVPAHRRDVDEDEENKYKKK